MAIVGIGPCGNGVSFLDLEAVGPAVALGVEVAFILLTDAPIVSIHTLASVCSVVAPLYIYVATGAAVLSHVLNTMMKQ